jgi:hypothetical protein
MRICRRLFVVLLANNDHGKTTMIRALVSQGLGKAIEKQKKGVRKLTSPWGRPIDAYIFGRSYQEVEKGNHDSVEEALDANDADWRERELVIMPSHVSHIENEDEGDDDDIDQMIDVAHSAGFDVICATVSFAAPKGSSRTRFSNIWRKPWDERWTIPNPRTQKPDGQLEALGRDLWAWVCRALAS